MTATSDFPRLGIAFIVSGPSGTGKTTLCRQFLNSDIGIRFSVSCTTRQPRAGEVDGRDYHFVSVDAFQERIQENAFIEYAEVHGNFYGTLKSEVEDHVLNGQDVFLDIDIQGATQIQESTRHESWRKCTQYIFIAPPSIEELERRLRSRGTETDAVIAARMDAARVELANWRKYDYLIVNRDLDEAMADMLAVFRAERRRASRILAEKPWG